MSARPLPRSRLDNLIAPLLDGQSLVALVPATGDLKWAAAAAWDVARAAAQHGRRVALVDLWIEDPTLHEVVGRSEEHTSELQSLAYLVCRLLLEKKKNLLSVITFAPPWIAALPGLGLRQGLVLTQASTPRSIVCPASHRVGIAGRLVVLRSSG